MQLSLFDSINIPLTKGYVAIVDPIDADLAEVSWYVTSGNRGSNKYAKRRFNKSTLAYLHRVVLSRMLNRPLLKTEEVDHINLNSLDNRRTNLRLANRSQNVSNQGKPKTNTSGFKGVSWYKANRKYVARIKFHQKNIHLGYFDDPYEAHMAYQRAAQDLFGDFARFK